MKIQVTEELWLVFRGVDWLCDVLKQIEHNKQLPGQKLTLSVVASSRNLSKYHSKIFPPKKSPSNPPRYPFGNQRHQTLRCIFSSGIAADVDNLPRNTRLFVGERWMDGNFLLKNQNSWQLWMFFSIEKCEKKCKPWENSCVANKNL